MLAALVLHKVQIQHLQGDRVPSEDLCQDEQSHVDDAELSAC